MTGLATLIFLFVVFWGHQIFGWTQGNTDIQMALFLCFVCGTIAGYKLRA